MLVAVWDSKSQENHSVGIYQVDPEDLPQAKIDDWRVVVKPIDTKIPRWARNDNLSDMLYHTTPIARVEDLVRAEGFTFRENFTWIPLSPGREYSELRVNKMVD